MKKVLFSILIIAGFVILSCGEEKESINFTSLTSNIWLSDSLLANGEDASGPGEYLEKFNGIINFKKDGTGIFGEYSGNWVFAYEETKIVISSDSLLIPLTANIDLLNNADLKMSAIFPNLKDPANPVALRMTFKAQ